MQGGSNGFNNVPVVGSSLASPVNPLPSNNRSRSVTPSNNRTSSVEHVNRMLYAELQFPVTSNYGSMKKKSQRSRTDIQHHYPSTTISNNNNNNSHNITVVTSATSASSGSTEYSSNATQYSSETLRTASPIHPADQQLHHHQQQQQQQQHRYVPEYIQISSNRKTAV